MSVNHAAPVTGAAHPARAWFDKLTMTQLQAHLAVITNPQRLLANSRSRYSFQGGR